MESIYSLIYGQSNLMPVAVLGGLFLLGIFRPERISNVGIYRLAWIVTAFSMITTAILFLFVAAPASRSEPKSSLLPLLGLIQPGLTILGSLLALAAIRLGSAPDSPDR